MRTIVSLSAAVSLVLASAVAAADEPAPQEFVVPPAVESPTVPNREVIVLRDDGWKPGTDPSTRMRSKGLVIGGVITAATGLAGIIAGSVMIASDTAKPSSRDACNPQVVQLTAGEACVLGAYADGLSGLQKDLGRVFAVAGGVTLAGGIAMTVAGAWQVPLAKPTREQQARGIPAITVGPGQASLRWSF